MTGDHLEGLKELICFLQPSFPQLSAYEQPYSNMAALLADVSLQAGMNYATVVRPRIRAILQTYPNCERTDDVSRILETTTVEKLLRWKGPEKIQIFKQILALLNDCEVYSIGDLARWTDTPDGQEALLHVTGIGLKTLDYLRLLCGNVAFPIDRYFIRFLRLAGIDVATYGYGYAQKLLINSCAELGLEPRITEKNLWLLLRLCA